MKSSYSFLIMCLLPHPSHPFLVLFQIDAAFMALWLDLKPLVHFHFHLNSPWQHSSIVSLPARLKKIPPPLSLSHLLSLLYQLLSTHQNFSTVNLPRASSLYGSTSNLSSSRAFRGSNPNLASHPGTIKANFYWATVFYSRYGEVELLLLVHELGAEQTEAEAGHCQESGKGGDMDGDMGTIGSWGWGHGDMGIETGI